MNEAQRSKESDFDRLVISKFEQWLRVECFQKPTPEAHDLAKSAWKQASNDRELTRLLNEVLVEHMGDLSSDLHERIVTAMIKER